MVPTPPESGLRATWLGHSTVLIEIDGLRVLTDPVWGNRASPLRLAGPKRFQPVPVALRAMPPLDPVRGLARPLRPSRLSDHTRAGQAGRALRNVARRRRAPRIVGRARRSESPSSTGGSRTRCRNTGLTVTAAPSQHFSGRGLHDRNATLWSSFVMRGAAARRVLQRRYRAHDRIPDDPRAPRPIRPRHARGGRTPSGMGRHAPGSGERPRSAGACSAADALLPVHWGTFSLATHAWDEPAETLLRLAPKARAQLVMPRLGEPIEPSRVERVEPWWRMVDATPQRPDSAAEIRLPKAVPWPLD